MVGVRKLLIGLVLLVGAAVLVDFGAAAYAEYSISREVRRGGNLASDPKVTVGGFPFALQVARGQYDDIAIRADRVPTPTVGEVAIEANLRGVHAPFKELVDGSINALEVDEIDGRVVIGATELGQFLKIPDLEVSAPPASNSDGTGGSGGSGPTTAGGVVLSGTVPVGLTSVKVSVQADLLLVGDSVQLVASDFYFGSDGKRDLEVPDAIKPAVLALFSGTIGNGQLPFGVRPVSVTASGAQIVIEGVGENVLIDMDEVAGL
jgi:hypothetical protein